MQFCCFFLLFSSFVSEHSFFNEGIYHPFCAWIHFFFPIYPSTWIEKYNWNCAKLYAEKKWILHICRITVSVYPYSVHFCHAPCEKDSQNVFPKQSKTINICVLWATICSFHFFSLSLSFCFDVVKNSTMCLEVRGRWNITKLNRLLEAFFPVACFFLIRYIH